MSKQIEDQDPGGFDANDGDCECGHRFNVHEQPSAGIPWDVSLCACTSCDCTEYRDV